MASSASCQGTNRPVPGIAPRPATRVLSPDELSAAFEARDRSALFLAGAVASLTCVLAATALEFEPKFVPLVVQVAGLGTAASWLFRRAHSSAVAVNAALVLATLAAWCPYVAQTPWHGFFAREGVWKAFEEAGSDATCSLVLRALAFAVAFRTFGVLRDRDVVLNLLPGLGVIALLCALHPPAVMLPYLMLFAAGCTLCLHVTQRLRCLSCHNQLGSVGAQCGPLRVATRPLLSQVVLAAAATAALTAAWLCWRPVWPALRHHLTAAKNRAWVLALKATGRPCVSAGDSLSLARPAVRLQSTVLFEVKAGSGCYWRTHALDRYTGRGWRAAATEHHGLSASEEGVPLGRGAAPPDYRSVEQTVTARAPMIFSLPCAYRPVWVGPGPDHPEVAPDGGLHCREILVAGDTYVVVSCVPDGGVVAEPEPLTGRGRARCLALPAIPIRVRQWARVTAAQPQPGYAAAQRLREAVSKRCGYTVKPGRFPPRRDLVDYFLFERRRGYCAHFASAMVVCLRAVGIPSRVVSGYASGDFDPEKEAYVVRQRHAHAWVEAWFPERGWCSFDPTEGAKILLGPEGEEDRSERADRPSANSSQSGSSEDGNGVSRGAKPTNPQGLRPRPQLRRTTAGIRALERAAWLACFLALAGLGAAELNARRHRESPPTTGAPRWGRPPIAPRVGLSLEEGVPTVADLYEEAASLVAGRFAPRADPQTFHEYARLVRQRLPGPGEAFQRLTDLYAEYRYTEAPSEPAKVEAASRLLKEVHRQARTS